MLAADESGVCKRGSHDHKQQRPSLYIVANTRISFHALPAPLSWTTRGARHLPSHLSSRRSMEPLPSVGYDDAIVYAMRYFTDV